jgi:hypothetical protein
MTIPNLLPRDLVTVMTMDGNLVQAEVVDIKRDRLQLVIVGKWLSDRQHKDARRSIQLTNIADIERTGRKPDPFAAIRAK